MLKLFAAAPTDRRSKARLASVAGRWCLLLSHPNDFAEQGFEADRWVLLIADALSRAKLRALALEGERDAAATWIAQLEDPQASSSAAGLPRGVIDLRLRALEGAIASAARARCVVIVDDKVRVHRTFTYPTSDQAPSLFDLIAYAERVRGETETDRGLTQLREAYFRRRTA